MNQSKKVQQFLQVIIDRIVNSGAGEVYVTQDGHLFVKPCMCFNALWGAMDMKKEGDAAGVRIVVRKVRKRAKNSKYADMPWLQLYVLPIVKKDAATMTDAERRNMDLNTQALKMAHAIERDPEQAAKYHELHEAHKRNPEGYKKLYPNFFGFLVATFRMQLESVDIPEKSEVQDAPEKQEIPECVQGIRLCVPRTQRLPLHRINRRTFRPFVRLPMAA